MTTELYLLRHADAGDPLAWEGPDAVRPLTKKGRRQAERLGEFLAVAGFAPDAIVASPKVRARETAELVGAALGRLVTVDERLAWGPDLGEIEGILEAAGHPRRVLLVGHDPALSELLGTLVGVAEIPLSKGALARVDVERPEAGGGALRWLVPPELLRAERSRER